MNILFLSLMDIDSLDIKNIYTDLLNCFRENKHSIYIASPTEKRKNKPTELIVKDDYQILKIRTGNIQKTNIIEKGISTLQIETQFKKAICKYFSEVSFDLVLYATPPITFSNVVEYIKKRDNAKTYLLLKDIFPQNAVDMGMISKGGLRGLLYKYFRAKEKKLYVLSEGIGCMSPANVDYILEHNSEISPEKVEVCPNSIDPIDMSVDIFTRTAIREKYGIPLDKKVFVYGGNLGKPQGIDFLIKCLQACQDINEVFFLIVGDGTEFSKIFNFVNNEKPKNIMLLKRLPKEEYDTMIAACDVGLIFLDYRFTIPNFPSRLLAYMQAGLPVLATTDTNSDMGSIIEEGRFGWYCESNDVDKFRLRILNILKIDLAEFEKNSYEFLNKHYSSEQCYKIVKEFIEGINR